MVFSGVQWGVVVGSGGQWGAVGCSEVEQVELLGGKRVIGLLGLIEGETADLLDLWFAPSRQCGSGESPGQLIY